MQRQWAGKAGHQQRKSTSTTSSPPPMIGTTKSRLGSSIRDLTKRGSSLYNNLEEEDLDRGMIEIVPIREGAAGSTHLAKDTVGMCWKDLPSSAPPPPATHLNVHRRTLSSEEVHNLRIDPDYDEVIEDAEFHESSMESSPDVLNLRRQTLSTSSFGGEQSRSVHQSF